MDEVFWLPAHKLRGLFVTRELSIVEHARSLLERVAAHDTSLNAFLSIDPDLVMAQARRAEQAVFDGDQLGPFHGVPVSLKDSLATADLPTTWGSSLYADYVAREDCAVARRVRSAGAIILGKTNVPEFQVIGRTKNRLIGETVNPWDVSRTAAGSSGGAAVSVAAGFNPIAIGGDDGGSTRLPSAYCGVFGLCPSAGRTPRADASAHGGFPGHLFQNIGPISRDVMDAAVMLDVIAGPDPSDPYAMPPLPQGWLGTMDDGVGGVSAAWIDFSAAQARAEVRSTVRAAAHVFASLGCEIEDVAEPVPEMPSISALQGAYLSAFFRDLAADPEKRRRLAPYVESYITTFAEPPSAEVERIAWRLRSEMMARMNALLSRYELLFSVTTGEVAPKVDDGWAPLIPTPVYAGATREVNAAGLCAVSLPCGFVDGLPVGLQIIGRRGAEPLLMRAARAFEQACPWSELRPALA